MAMRGWATSLPIWVRVPGIIALVLVGVLISTMLLNAALDGGGRPASDQTQMDGGGHGSGGGGGHGAGEHGR